MTKEEFAKRITGRNRDKADAKADTNGRIVRRCRNGGRCEWLTEWGSFKRVFCGKCFKFYPGE